MNEFKIVINAPPQAQGRPRFSVRGSHAFAWDPHKDKKTYAKLIIQQQFDKCLECPIELSIVFFMPIAKNVSKKKRALMLSNDLKHQKIKDLDNLAKMYMDAMTDIVYRDDKQVWKMKLEKRYSEDPRVEIVVYYED